jgi:hypothetical protein
MTRWTKLLMAVCACAVLALAGATTALAAGGNPVTNDCEANGQLTHSYTLAELQHALAVMPASTKQYTNCYDVIQNALIKARKNGSGGAGSSSGGSFLPTPVIVILVLLILAAVTFGALAARRRRGPGGPGGAGPGGPGGPGAQP